MIMKTLIYSLLIFLGLLFTCALYQRYTYKKRDSYWLAFANKAVTDDNSTFLNFYDKYKYHLTTMTIEEGWVLYNRYTNK